jgi:hypothetical protein
MDACLSLMMQAASSMVIDHALLRTKSFVNNLFGTWHSVALS